MKREGRIYYDDNVEDARYLYLKEISFYLDITNYLLYNYEKILTVKENLILISNIKKVNKLLKIFKNTVSKINVDKEKLDYILYLFNKIVSRTSKIEFKVFKEELTRVEDYRAGKNFNFLVHTITPGNNRLTNSSDITSASLINEENISLFVNGENVNTYGYILECDLDNIIVSCNADVFSDIKPKEVKKKIIKTFDKYFKYDNFEVKISPVNMHGISNIAKIIPLNYLKRVNVDECIKANFEKLNYDNAEIYNEIVLLNNEKLIKKAVFVRTLGDRTISKDYKKALELSKKSGLPLIEIDLSLYREQSNLDLLTPQEEKKIKERFLEILKEDNETYIAYYFSDKNISFDSICIKMYKELREKRYLDEKELKKYLLDFFKKENVNNKVKQKIS